MASELRMQLADLKDWGRASLEEHECSLDQFLIEFNELTTGEPVSLLTFQRLVEEHYESVTAVRQQLRDGLAECAPHGLESLSKEDVASLDAFDDLLRRISTLMTNCAPHVDWTELQGGNFDNKLRKWLQGNNLGLNQTTSEEGKISIPARPEWRAIQDSYAQARMAVRHSKRPLASMSLGGSPPKRQKNQFTPGNEWYGPNKSKLACTNRFFEIVRQYKAYLNNPPDEPGTTNHKNRMEDFLKQGLAETNLGTKLDNVMLKRDWTFRNRTFEIGRVPSFVVPGAGEATWRLGGDMRLGLNAFKATLGGGLTADELSTENNPAAHAFGMLASSTSLSPKEITLRGGGSNLSAADKLAQTQRHIRKSMKLRFRAPHVLWAQIQEDADFPAGHIPADSIYNGDRPPMMDPNRGGKTIDTFRRLFPTALRVRDWNAIESEDDPDKLRELATRHRQPLADMRRTATAFIYDNENRIMPNQPSLLEPGGKAKPRQRFKNIYSRDFVGPLKSAFKARMAQLLILLVYWKLYQLNRCTLQDLLAEERENLAIWIEMEELFIEWENNRWFELTNRAALEDLENRYTGRKVVVDLWEGEIARIKDAINTLAQNPAAFDAPSPSGSNKGQADADPNKSLLTPESQKKGKKKKTQAHGEGDHDDGQEDSSMSTSTNLGSNPTREATALSVNILEKSLRAYEDQLALVISQNNELDDLDPGNAAHINRNNLDIMAKQQVIWSLRTELENLQRTLDPHSDSGIGKGASHSWEVQTNESYWRNTRVIPKKPPVPLGITSVGLGPLPAQRPYPRDPRVLVGAPEKLGKELYPQEEDVKPADYDLFSTPGDKGPAPDSHGNPPDENPNAAPDAAGPDTSQGEPSAQPAPEGAGDTAGVTDPAASQSQFLAEANRLYLEASQTHEALKKQAKEATKYAQGAKMTAEVIDSTPIRDAVRVTENTRISAEKLSLEAAIKAHIAHEALTAQSAWGTAPETIAQLRQRYGNLTQDFEAWRKAHTWGDWPQTPETMTSMWAIEATRLMYECWKLVGQNPGPQYWLNMHQTFWESSGDTLEKKRMVWLYSLTTGFNDHIRRNDSSAKPFLEPLPPPPEESVSNEAAVQDVPGSQPVTNPKLVKNPSPPKNERLTETELKPSASTPPLSGQAEPLPSAPSPRTAGGQQSRRQLRMDRQRQRRNRGKDSRSREQQLRQQQLQIQKRQEQQLKDFQVREQQYRERDRQSHQQRPEQQQRLEQQRAQRQRLEQQRLEQQRLQQQQRLEQQQQQQQQQQGQQQRGQQQQGQQQQGQQQQGQQQQGQQQRGQQQQGQQQQEQQRQRLHQRQPQDLRLRQVPLPPSRQPAPQAQREQKSAESKPPREQSSSPAPPSMLPKPTTPQPKTQTSTPPDSPETTRGTGSSTSAAQTAERQRIHSEMVMTNDAWPELATLLQATWNAKLAHAAMEQLPSASAEDPARIRADWPAPVRTGWYYDL